MRILILSLVFLILSAMQTGMWKGRQGSIRFVSEAPLEVIRAESSQLSGIVNPKENTFAFTVPTISFEGFNSPLQQEHFHENYMESREYPRASFSGKFIENLANLGEGTHEVRAKGQLKIHGQSTERILKCTLHINDKEVQIRSEFRVPLSDHNITIPRVVHQKIAEEIKVMVDISLQLDS